MTKELTLQEHTQHELGAYYISKSLCRLDSTNVAGDDWELPSLLMSFSISHRSTISSSELILMTHCASLRTKRTYMWWLLESDCDVTDHEFKPGGMGRSKKPGDVGCVGIGISESSVIKFAIRIDSTTWSVQLIARYSLKCWMLPITLNQYSRAWS
jgi:hypothetical protein